MSRKKRKHEVTALSERNNNISLRSEAAQEVISRRGGFLENRALLLFLLVIFLIIVGTWFIRYPDVINARGILSAENAPKEIKALQSGRLVKLFVKNGELVHKGDMIAWMESTANTNNVLALSRTIDSCSHLMAVEQYQKIAALLAIHYADLGALQAQYQLFITAFEQYNDYYVNGFFDRKKQMAGKDVATLKQLQEIIRQKRTLSSRDRDSAGKSLDMYKYLLKEKIISPEEFRNQESKFISKQMILPQYNENLLANETQQREKLKEIEQLDHDEQQQRVLFTQALETFKSHIDEWLHQYTICAPADGKIVFAIPLQQNKFIDASRPLAFINPMGSKYYIDIFIPQENFGKVDTGMQVQLRFDAYPYQEDGYVQATISYLSPMVIDSGFLATATLNHGLITHLHKPVQYKSGLKAQALIITKDMRLLQRLYYNMRKSLSPGN